MYPCDHARNKRREEESHRLHGLVYPENFPCDSLPARFETRVLEFRGINPCEIAMKVTATRMMLINVSSAVKKNGVEKSNQPTREESASFSPMKGPIIKPTPKAIPSKPKFFGFDCGPHCRERVLQNPQGREVNSCATGGWFSACRGNYSKECYK